MKDNFLKVQSVISEVGKVVVGQDLMIKRLLMGLFTNGHILLEGVPRIKFHTVSTYDTNKGKLKNSTRTHYNY